MHPNVQYVTPADLTPYGASSLSEDAGRLTFGRAASQSHAVQRTFKTTAWPTPRRQPLVPKGSQLSS